MKPNTLPPVLILLALSATTLAEDIRPGLWKISLESRVAATPDWNPEPFELTQCLTADDAQHPERLLTGAGGAGVADCVFPGLNDSGGHVRFEVACGGRLGLKGHGEMGFTATRIDGVLDVEFGGEEKTAMANKLHAAYLGECPGTGGSGPVPSAPTRLPAPPAE